MAEQLPGFRISALVNSNGQALYSGPREGSDLLDWVGPGKARIAQGVPMRARSEPFNPSIEWTFQGVGDDAFTLKKTTPITGQERGGGGALERQTADILVCALFAGDVDAFNQWMVGLAQQGFQEITPEQLVEYVVGREVYVEVGTMRSNRSGQPLSTIDRVLTPEQYERKINTQGQGRRPRPELPAAGAAPGAPVPVGGATPNFGGVRPGTPPAGGGALAPAPSPTAPAPTLQAAPAPAAAAPAPAPMAGVAPAGPTGPNGIGTTPGLGASTLPPAPMPPQ